MVTVCTSSCNIKHSASIYTVYVCVSYYSHNKQRLFLEQHPQLGICKRDACLLNLDVNILGGRVRTAKKNAEALVVASKENGLEINDDKS